jgi:hypothetical protein
VLLKGLVARVSGMTFAEFTRRRLFEPLGMKSTAYRLDVAIENRALAYEKQGDGWKMDVLVDHERGGGGALFSTASDLVRWNDALAARRLGKSVTAKLEEPARLRNGRRLDYGRALFLDHDPRSGRIVWHSGSAGAYKSLTGRYTDHGFSVAILCNAGDVSGPRAKFANRLFELFVPGADAAGAAPVKAPDAAASVEGVDPASRAGVWFSEAGDALRLSVQDGRLRIARGPALVAVTKDRFRAPKPSLEFMSGDDFELTFVAADELEWRSMEGKTTRYRRAQVIAPTAAQLAGFAGRYRSDEIGAVIQLSPGTDGLVARLEHSPDKSLPLQPVDRDAFQVANMTLRFVRDPGGSAVGFDYSNPVIRRVRFTRLGDGVSAQ